MTGKKANEEGESHLAIIPEILSRDGGFMAPRLRRSGPGGLAEMVDLASTPNLMQSTRILARKVGICVHQFGDPFVVDFLVYDSKWPGPLALLCMSQTSGGSIYWKVPAWVECVRDYFPPDCRAALVLAGRGFSPGLLAYADQCIGRTHGKFCRVFPDIDDFRNWVRDGAEFPARAQMELPLPP